MLVKEERIAVPAGDGKTIYAVLSRSPPAAGRAILAVHGLAGQPDDFLLRWSRDPFLAAGFDVCRPALYSWEHDARDLRDATLAQHVADLRAVFAYLARDYPDVFLVGHSYGGIALVLARLNAARAMSLWDCLFAPERLWSDLIACEPAAGPDYLELCDPLRVQVGRAMREEGAGLTTAAMQTAAARISLPVQLVVAGRGRHTKPEQDYAVSFPGPVDRVLLPEADHLFARGTVVNDLTDATLRWFARQPAGA